MTLACLQLACPEWMASCQLACRQHAFPRRCRCLVQVHNYRGLHQRYQEIAEENRQLYNTVQVRWGTVHDPGSWSCTR